MLELATTRPETMLGDTGVAVNPADRALCASAWARHVMLPLVNREIPVVARRVCGHGIRHRRGKDDPRARPQRL